MNPLLQGSGNLLLNSLSRSPRISSVTDRAADNEIVSAACDGAPGSHDSLLIVLGRDLIVEDGTDPRADCDQRMIDGLPERSHFQAGRDYPVTTQLQGAAGA